MVCGPLPGGDVHLIRDDPAVGIAHDDEERDRSAEHDRQWLLCRTRRPSDDHAARGAMTLRVRRDLVAHSFLQALETERAVGSGPGLGSAHGLVSIHEWVERI